ncbi:GSCOCT00013853001.3-RA-CDS, partial [Cotesia congregata]
MVEQVPANYGNFHQEIYLPRSFLHFCGLWPSATFLHFSSILIIILIVLWLPFAAFLFSSDSIEDIVESTGYVLSVTNTIITMLIVRWNFSSITAITNHMSDNWLCMPFISNEDKQMLQKNLLSSKFVLRLAFSFVIFCVITFSTMPYIFAAILGHELPRQVARVAWYPFPLENFFVILLTSIFTIATIFIDSLIDVAIDAFTIMAVFHCEGQLSLLCSTIYKYRGLIRHSGDNFTELRSYQKSCPCLKCIVDHHVDIGLFSAQEKNISGIIIHLLYVCWSGFSLIIYCSLGEKLSKKSEEVERAVCEIDWSVKKSKQSRSLMLIIIRSRKAFAITAGKIFTMNLLFYKEVSIFL